MLIKQGKSLFYIICGIFVIITIIGVILALTRLNTRPMLVMASTGFVLTALTALVKNKSRYGILVVVGLIFCWLGDFSGQRSFKASVVAFALAHLSFIIAFLIRGIKGKRLLVSLGIFLISSLGIFYWLYPHVSKSDQSFVFIYMIIITAMVVIALGSKLSYSQIIISYGAILFYVSDIFVARWRFVDPSGINAFFCYPLYYSSCLLFAISISRER
jgi:uncharacterized membrane protein YhhN